MFLLPILLASSLMFFRVILKLPLLHEKNNAASLCGSSASRHGILLSGMRALLFFQRKKNFLSLKMLQWKYNSLFR